MEEDKTYAVITMKVDGEDVDIFLHEFIMPPPDGYETYHINGNTLDNRKANLAFRKLK